MSRPRPSGFTLVELLIALTVFLLVVPAIIGAVLMTQRTTNRTNQETVVRQKFRVQLDRIVQDVRESRAVFSPSNVSISSHFAIPDEISGLQLPNGITTATTSPYLQWPARGSALALMKYDATVTVGSKTADTYKVVAYYLKRPGKNDGDYDPSSPAALSLRRFVSTKTYMDMTALTSSERSTAASQGYVAWTPQGEGRTPNLPETPIAGASRLLISSIAPGDAWVRGHKVPPPGGFAVSRDGNLLTIHLVGYAAGQAYVLQSQTAARNFAL